MIADIFADLERLALKLQAQENWECLTLATRIKQNVDVTVQELTKAEQLLKEIIIKELNNGQSS